MRSCHLTKLILGICHNSNLVVVCMLYEKFQKNYTNDYKKFDSCFWYKRQWRYLESIHAKLISSGSVNCQSFKFFLIIFFPQSIGEVRGYSPCIFLHFQKYSKNYLRNRNDYLLFSTFLRLKS